MKNTTSILLGGLFTFSNVIAQDTPGNPVVPPPATGNIQPPVDIPTAPGQPAVADVPAGVEPPEVQPGVDAPAAQGENPIAEDESGLLIKDASINDIFQLLARRAGKQYFHNNQLNSEDYKVTGHLNDDAGALKQMEELAFQYGIRMYVKGNTVYAMLDDQLNRLPAKEWTYQLNYLRPTDIEQIRALIQPLLTEGRGIVNFEPKTNTIVVIDTMHHIENVERVLRKIDQPKGQIVVEVKILSVNSNHDHSSGVDWSSSLGANSGVNLDIIRSLNSVFGFGGTFAGEALTSSGTAGASQITGSNGVADTVSGAAGNIILSPFQVSGVLRALNEGNLVKQKSNPVIITEDNETAIISLIDRVPIITATSVIGDGATTITDEVRYRIDESDSIEPESTREIGVTITVTPSLLPDGTIRMNMRPRNAQITENVTGPSGNVYPRVSEATIQTIARIPDAHSLVVGGFYGEVQGNDKSKVPLLGDIPIFNFFFKSKQTSKESSSLVFVVTPSSYNPTTDHRSHHRAYDRVKSATRLPSDHDHLDPRNPGSGTEPNWQRTIRGIKLDSQPDNYPQP